MKLAKRVSLKPTKEKRHTVMEIRSAEKRLRRLQRQVSRKYEMNKEGTVTSKQATL
ncbi:hypothetical protein ACFWM3_22885 [Gottfriedia sp. NPDC058432]|uniref:hypothetical protein n=1 Tax=Gottfriedia sp. NPDC058432 TaxID=3346497 RepID=UPI00365C9592